MCGVGRQWQRAALVRALYALESGVCILVLDEPTANLDVRAEAEFLSRLSGRLMQSVFRRVVVQSPMTSGLVNTIGE